MSLQRISLRDFVIVRQLELEFGAGFTVLSGETGAGKSILIDALQLVLGARAEASVVREGAARSELCAEFSTPAHLHPWLQDNGFDAADDLLLKRSIDAQGKSRAWINGSPATATQLREIGDQLLDIHGQHAWQSLTRPSAVRELLDAYAHLLAGTVELYEATLDPNHLTFAVQLAEALIERFYDAAGGGFWQSGADTPHLLMRVKEDYDGAEPSGNAVASLALLRLSTLCARPDWREAAEKTLRLFAQKLHQTPQVVPFLLCALDFALQEPKRVVVVGDWLCGSTRALLSHEI
jgi:energy-coupling factor transporter ATP-binding protein EcfA2